MEIFMKEHYENPSKVQICVKPVTIKVKRFRLNVSKPKVKFWFQETAWKSDMRIFFCHSHYYSFMKIQSLYISDGNRHIEAISHWLSVTSQARLFTNNKKLWSLFFHMTPIKGCSWRERSLELKNVITILW